MLVNVASICSRIGTTRQCRAISRLQSSLKTVNAKNLDVNALVYVPQCINPAVDTDLPLYDVPVAIKDNICTASMPTTCSSSMLTGFTSPFNATVVELLQSAGAPIIGKANCDEFGMGSLNMYSSCGPVVNPYQPKSRTTAWSERERRYAGGSSGGSAAAVAAGMCPVALGTDTGGSIRLPASYCGVVGLKPSYGIISRWGVVSFADSLDCVGIIGQNVDYVKRTFGILSKYDKKDLSSAKPPTRTKAQEGCREALINWQSSLSGLRVGIPQEYFPAETDRSVLGPLKQVIKNLQKVGVTVVPVQLPSTPYALSAYYVIASAEASSNMARYDGIQYGLRVDPPPGADARKAADVYGYTRTQCFGPEVKRRILLGTYALSADAFDNYFLQAQRVRKLIRADFDKVFRHANVLMTGETSVGPEGVDVLLHPSAIRTAPPIPDASIAVENSSEESNGLESSLEDYVQDVLTVPASLAGLPAISVPAGLADDQWPIGVSVVGQWGYDEMVLRVAEIIEDTGRDAAV